MCMVIVVWCGWWKEQPIEKANALLRDGWSTSLWNDSVELGLYHIVRVRIPYHHTNHTLPYHNIIMMYE